MSMTLHKSGSVVHALLSGELTVADAATIYHEIFAELDDEASLVIDAEGVTRMDGSIAQLFLFASRYVRDFQVNTRSISWEKAFALLGQGLLTSDLDKGVTQHAQDDTHR